MKSSHVAEEEQGAPDWMDGPVEKRRAQAGREVVILQPLYLPTLACKIPHAPIFLCTPVLQKLFLLHGAVIGQSLGVSRCFAMAIFGCRERLHYCTVQYSAPKSGPAKRLPVEATAARSDGGIVESRRIESSRIPTHFEKVRTGRIMSWAVGPTALTSSSSVEAQDGVQIPHGPTQKWRR